MLSCITEACNVATLSSIMSSAIVCIPKSVMPSDNRIYSSHINLLNPPNNSLTLRGWDNDVWAHSDCASRPIRTSPDGRTSPSRTIFSSRPPMSTLSPAKRSLPRTGAGSGDSVAHWRNGGFPAMVATAPPSSTNPICPSFHCQLIANKTRRHSYTS
jgi:hypothetical protein